jgi:hypothetical protein
VHGRRLEPDQELALREYLKKLDEMGIPARLHIIEQAAMTLLRQDCDAPSQLGPQWGKRWLDRQPDLFKVKRKPIPIARKNAHDLELLMGHFTLYNKVVSKYGILPDDQWNFDETGFRMGIARSDYVVTMDVTRRIYSKCPDNRESMTAIECINGTGLNIPPMLITTGVQILAPFFNNDLDDDIIITTADTGYTNDWISLQWVKHFDKFSARYQKGAWRLLLMDGFGSHHTYEFLTYCEERQIIHWGFHLIRLICCNHWMCVFFSH